MLIIKKYPQGFLDKEHWMQAQLNAEIGEHSGLKVIPGFTLAELLIALGILGIIATFTIPKILNAQRNNAKVAATKEVMATLATAFQQHKLNGLVTVDTHPNDLLSKYFNYVTLDSTSAVDMYPGGGAGLMCSTGTATCYRLHNGGLVRPWNCTLGNVTDPAYAIAILFDADGVYTGDEDSVRIFVHSNGQVQTEGTATAGTTIDCSSPIVSAGPDPTKDPSWFSW
jgi:prepilin-type N-terminal cleavage/methylation domain-containing protein